jgi:hypothetical protein
MLGRRFAGHNTLDPSINRTNARNGKWTAVEDGKMKGGVKKHICKDWAAIAALVPGRTSYSGSLRSTLMLDPTTPTSEGLAEPFISATTEPQLETDSMSPKTSIF